MTDSHIRKEGHAGRITLQRPKALNALTYDMCLAIESALDKWRDDPSVKFVIIDAEGEKAFCAGGDIQELYDSGMAGNFAYGQKFWADEYRLNAKISEYPKPYVALMQGFTMGGGVGVSCHGSHRIVGDSSQIAMPECGIGLIPDVGGSLILARAPGRLGDYLGLTATRMGASDAIYAGFADIYISELKWPEMIAQLVDSGDISVIQDFAAPAPVGRLAGIQPKIDAAFAGNTLQDIAATLEETESDLAASALKAIKCNSPLSMAVTIETLRHLRTNLDIRAAVHLEYRYTYRAMEMGDFLEGIRAAIIDKDRNPVWKHKIANVTSQDVAAMLAPLGDKGLNLKEHLS